MEFAGSALHTPLHLTPSLLTSPYSFSKANLAPTQCQRCPYGERCILAFWRPILSRVWASSNVWSTQCG